MGARNLRVLMLTSVIVVLVVWYSVIPRNYPLDIEDNIQENNLNINEVRSTLEKFHEPQILPSAVNRTWSEARVLMYNRVPKCGSSTINVLIKRLSDLNNFAHYPSKVQFHHILTEEEELKLVKKRQREVLANPDKPISFEKHVCFINFTKYNAARPIYISIFRNPVSTFVSTFYYSRAADRLFKLLRGNETLYPHYLKVLLAKDRQKLIRDGKDPGSYHSMLPNVKWLHKSLEGCILNGDAECKFTPQFVSYICGSKPECRKIKNRDALQKAKLNLESEYSVVGIIEHLNVSLEVMEAYIPRYFTGVQDLFSKLGHHQHANQNKHVDPSPEIKAIIADNLSTDFELYEFAKQRLFLQHRALTNQDSPR